jgi:ppGpp synthetase/RelA/SpoT-type nucleotidyltranferase
MSATPTFDGFGNESREDARLVFDARVDPQRAAYEEHRPVLEAARRNLEGSCLQRIPPETARFVRATSRVKGWSEVVVKLEDGRALSWDRCADLVGVKLIVMSTTVVEAALEAVADLRMDGRLPSEQHWHSSRGRSRGYSATHLQLVYPDQPWVPEGCRQVGAELQVLTELQQAWDLLTHDEFYKAKRGVPARIRERLLRLGAAVSLLDQEIVELAEELGHETSEIVRRLKHSRARGDGDWKAVRVDEVSLIAASELQLKAGMSAMAELAGRCGFRRSIWKEHVRLGEEMDLFLSLCQTHDVATLGELQDLIDEAPRLEDTLTRIAREAFYRQGLEYSLFDRPLTVLGVIMLLMRGDYQKGMFRPEIMTAVRGAMS